MTDKELRKLLREIGRARKEKMTAPGTTLKTWGLGLCKDTTREGMYVPKLTPQNRWAVEAAAQSQQIVPLDMKVGQGRFDGEEGDGLLIDAIAHTTTDDSMVQIELHLLRERIAKELLTFNTRRKRNVGAYLTVFDGLLEAEPLYIIAKQVVKEDGTTGVTGERVSHMIEVIKSMPAWRRFEAEVRSTLNA